MSMVLSTTAQETAAIKGEEVTYTSADGTVLKGYVVFNEKQKGKSLLSLENIEQ